MPIRKVLIANRGEIAVRILRALRELGITSVAVFSDADRVGLHVRLADEAVPIGPAPSNESYLRIDRIIEAARATGADAIHPGYGFLAENPAFAREVVRAGLIFIGPSASTIELMGNKLEGHRPRHGAGDPGSPPSPTRRRRRKTAAGRLPGDAQGGGGAAGMRRPPPRPGGASPSPAARPRPPAATTRSHGEAHRGASHVEIQVLADAHGSAIHLGERDCSISAGTRSWWRRPLRRSSTGPRAPRLRQCNASRVMVDAHRTSTRR
jgi:acetyl/propionyl-CoA carboxylase alpha subunit